MIKIKLPNGLYLTAEQNTDPAFPHEVYVGITDENGRWLQDLVGVMQRYHWDGNEKIPDDGIDIFVYGDEENEDYTDNFEVGFWKGAE